jgi:prolipoprotein diacylglyceryltransferase
MSEEKTGEQVAKSEELAKEPVKKELTEAEKNAIVEKAIAEGKKMGPTKSRTFWPDFWAFLTMIAGGFMMYREIMLIIKAMDPFGGLYNLGAAFDGAVVLALGIVLLVLRKHTSMPKFFKFIGIIFCLGVALPWIVNFCHPLLKGLIEAVDNFFTVRMH